MEPQFIPSRAEFRELTQGGNVIPVYADLIADSETPVSAFSKLDRGGYSFLFESTEKNDVSGRFSFVGTDPRIVICRRDDEIEITEHGKTRTFQSSSHPLSELRRLMAQYQFVARPELPRFVGGAVGFLGYDATRFFELTVPVAERDELELPEMLFMITGPVVIFDHRLRTVRILNNAFFNPSPYMFCLNFGGGFSLVGSSPEMHVRAVDGLVEIRPIAGTRKRGQTPAEDEQNAVELLADAKERAEHVMLVDLARNDVGRIAQFGSVRVTEKMNIERYSNVRHI